MMRWGAEAPAPTDFNALNCLVWELTFHGTWELSPELALNPISLPTLTQGDLLG